MTIIYVQYCDKTSVVNGTDLIMDTDHLYVYNGEELIGVYRLSEVTAAYKTTKASD